MAQKLFKLFYFYLPPNCKTPLEINSCIDIYGTSYLLLQLKKVLKMRSLIFGHK